MLVRETKGTEARAINQKSLIRSGRFEKWSDVVAGRRLRQQSRQASLSRGSPKMFPRTLKTRRRHRGKSTATTRHTSTTYLPTTLFISTHLYHISRATTAQQ